MTLDMLNVMLAVSEEGMIEEMLLALLASPQLAVFFEKFPRLKNIIAADIPRWREAVRARLKEVNIPPDLDAEVQTYLHLAVYRPAPANSRQTAPAPVPFCRPGAEAGGRQCHLYPSAAYAVFTALAPEPGGASHQP